MLLSFYTRKAEKAASGRKVCKDCGEDGLTEMSTEGQRTEPLSVRVRARCPQWSAVKELAHSFQGG